jgi:fructose/tagatose bisphosphate aldolase
VRAPFRELLGAADRHAVGAFTCYDLEVAAAVLGAAAAAGRGVILLLGNASFTAPDGPLLLAALVAKANVAGLHGAQMATVRRVVEEKLAALTAPAG